MRGQATDQDYEPGQPDEAPKAITQTRLRERGWTDKMVRELLGEPDERRENTSYPNRPPMRLYLLERIEEAERTDAFFELLDKSEKRKEAAGKASQKAQQTRLAKTTSSVEGLEINLPKLMRAALSELAAGMGNDDPGLLLKVRESADQVTHRLTQVQHLADQVASLQRQQSEVVKALTTMQQQSSTLETSVAKAVKDLRKAEQAWLDKPKRMF